MGTFEWVSADSGYILFVLVDLAAIFCVVAAMRWISRLIVRPKNQHAEGTNIETAAAVIALMIALMGVTSGEFSLSLLTEWLIVTAYGVLAVALLRLGAWLQDKIVLPALNLNYEAQNGNTSAALITGSHLIGTAIVIRAAMQWTSQDADSNFVVLIIAFIVAQVLLALETRIRLLWTGGKLIQAIEDKQDCEVFKAAAQHIGAALAISGSAHFVALIEDQFRLALVAWLFSSIIILIVYLALSELCVRIILPRKDAKENGRGYLVGAVFIGWGFLLPSLAS